MPGFHSAARAMLLALAVSSALAAAGPNTEPVYRALRDAAPTETFLVENILLRRDQGMITLKSGTIAFTPKVNGRDTVAVFEGEGVFAFQPAFSIEKERLQIFAGGNAVADTFDRALFCFTDHTGDEIRAQAHSVAAQPKLGDDAAAIFASACATVEPTVRSSWEALLIGKHR